MAMLAMSTVADEVKLMFSSLSLDSSNAGASKGATLSMVRLDGSRYDPWAVFHCFELRIGNPYTSSAAKNAYKPFTVTKKPKCLGDGKVEIGCRYRSRYVLQFWFEKLSDDAEKAAIQTIKIDSFTNPMSAQVLTDVELYAFSDSQCRKPSESVKLPGINIQPNTENGLKLKAGNL